MGERVRTLCSFDTQTMTGVMLNQKGIHNTIIITANVRVVNSSLESLILRPIDDVDNKT